MSAAEDVAVIGTAGGQSRPGGLRLKVPGLEWALDAPRLVSETLRAIPGVRDVRVDAFTGSIAVVYEPAVAARPATVEHMAPVQLPARRSARRPAPRLTGIAEAVLVVALEFALHQTLGLLFRRR